MSGGPLNLKFPDENTKQGFFVILRDNVRIPVCKGCGRFFSYGFPSNEDGLSDHIICVENDIICKCIHHDVVSRLIKQKGDSLIDISTWYHILGRR